MVKEIVDGSNIGGSGGSGDEDKVFFLVVWKKKIKI